MTVIELRRRLGQLPATELPSLIAGVHAAMKGSGASDPAPEPVTKPTAAQIRKSIQPTGLVNFEDGKVYKSLKRNLATRRRCQSNERKPRLLAPAPDFPGSIEGSHKAQVSQEAADRSTNLARKTLTVG